MNSITLYPSGVLTLEDLIRGIVREEAPTIAVPPSDPLRSVWVPVGYDLVFADEFDGDRLNQQKWWTRYLFSGPDGPGTLDWFPNEHSVHRFRETGNHVVSGGTLKIVAKPPVAPATTWTSGLIRAKKKFGKYGYYEMRAKVPDGLGTWATFWLSPEDMKWGGEIDIVERVHNGSATDNLNTVHIGNIGTTGNPGGSRPWPGANENHLIAKNIDYNSTWTYYAAPFNFSDDFHTWGCHWADDDTVTVFIDGVMICKWRYLWVHDDGTPSGYASLIANLGIGGDWPGAPTMAQQIYEIDYIRVYQRSKDAEPSTIGKDYVLS